MLHQETCTFLKYIHFLADGDYPRSAREILSLVISMRFRLPGCPSMMLAVAGVFEGPIYQGTMRPRSQLLLNSFLLLIENHLKLLKSVIWRLLWTLLIGSFLLQNNFSHLTRKKHCRRRGMGLAIDVKSDLFGAVGWDIGNIKK